MYYGICHLSVVPVRSTSSDKSEMVTQLLFGETVEILEKRGSWRRIRCTWDDYIGWIDHKQITLITPSEATAYEAQFAYNLELLHPLMGEGHYLPIPLCAKLPHFDGLRLRLQDKKYSFSGQAVFPNELQPSINLVLKIARKYMYAPYQWGGRSPLGIDCSGFTQNVFKMVGIDLPRDASQQVSVGEMVDFVEQARPGDLAFFENRSNRISHVGILCEDEKIIHASGCVRVDKIDHYGIYNQDIQKYTHRLRVVKRVLPAPTEAIEKRIEEEVKITNQADLFE